MKVYIRSTESISPQKTFLRNEIPENIIEYNTLLKNICPNFKEYFPPLLSRRINTLIKTGHVCAIETINKAGIEKPDAIITGSGLGCVASTEKFLNDMLKTNEGLLAPTSFIQSTSNAIGAQIALHYTCKGYNVLYAQKSLSFDCALQDALLRIKDNELVGGFDEITQENYLLKQNIGLYKKKPFPNLNMIKSNSTGSIAGEGASFFLLSDQLTDNNLAELMGVWITPSKLNNSEIADWIKFSIANVGLKPGDIDVIVSGFNGDIKTDRIYKDILVSGFSSSTHAYYKHLCGEYDAATAFGLWFSVMAVSNNCIPVHSLLSDKKRDYNKVLLYNQHDAKYHSLTLLQKPKS